MGRGELKIFANRSGEEFAKRILRELNKIKDDPIKLGALETRDFANQETLATINETIRGADVYLIQNCQDPNSKRSVHDNFIELCQTARGMKQSGANKITLVIPMLPYSRQDRKNGRQAITARWTADIMKVSGVDNVITADLHSDQIEGFYDGRIHIDNLKASAVFLNYIKEKIYNSDTTVFLAADVGASKKTQYYAKKLGTREIAQAFKTRSVPNQVDAIKIAGYVLKEKI
jgi:ribose-phosphate pyrophosphokinase